MNNSEKYIEDSPIFEELKDSKEYQFLSNSKFKEKYLTVTSWKDNEEKYQLLMFVAVIIGLLFTSISVYNDLEKEHLEFTIFSAIGVVTVLICICFNFFLESRCSLENELDEEQYNLLQKQIYFHQPSRKYVAQKLDECGKITKRDALYLRLNLNVELVKILAARESNLLNISTIKASMSEMKKDPN